MPDSHFRVPTDAKEVYLTFDDGPTPEATPFVLAQLGITGSKASFFCLGQQAEQYPNLLQEMQSAGHTIGNHTHSHVNGWNVTPAAYLQDVLQAQAVFDGILGEGSVRHFRPPYLRIQPLAAGQIRKTHSIVLGELMPGDFDPLQNVNTLLGRLQKHTRPGSIVILHDNAKCASVLRMLLPRYLSWLAENGYTLKALPTELSPSTTITKTV
jgi:peptidoglycan/xylan/chitin deacetylase (PgdA/CDA1 family)